MSKRGEATPNGIVYDPTYPDRHQCPKCGRDWINPDLPRLGMDTYACSFPGCGWHGTTVDLALYELGLDQGEPAEEPVTEYAVRVRYTYTVSAYLEVVVRADSKQDAVEQAEAEVEDYYADGVEVDADDPHVEYAYARLLTPAEKAEREHRAIAVTLALPLEVAS